MCSGPITYRMAMMKKTEEKHMLSVLMSGDSEIDSLFQTGHMT